MVALQRNCLNSTNPLPTTLYFYKLLFQSFNTPQDFVVVVGFRAEFKRVNMNNSTNHPTNNQWGGERESIRQEICQKRFKWDFFTLFVFSFPPFMLDVLISFFMSFDSVGDLEGEFGYVLYVSEGNVIWFNY